MFDWKLIVSPAFWFSLRWNPLTLGTAMLMATVFGALVLAGGFLLWTAGKKKKSDPLRRAALLWLGAPLILCGLGGELLTFFAYQQIPVFSARFWFLLLAAVFLATEISAVRFLFIGVPRRKSEVGARAQWSQYFPGRKRG